MKPRAWALALLVNALVAASVTWAVLWWWDQTHPCPAVPSAAGVAPTPAPAAVAATPSFGYVVQPDDTWEGLAARFGLPPGALQAFNDLPADAPLQPGMMLRVPGTPAPTPTAAATGVVIAAVLGPGSLEDEQVQLRNTSSQPVDLTGWTLEDQDGHRFVFPRVVLYPNAVLRVWSKGGTNTVDALYWGAAGPVWTSGETAVLRAADGRPVAEYIVP